VFRFEAQTISRTKKTYQSGLFSLGINSKGGIWLQMRVP